MKHTAKDPKEFLTLYWLSVHSLPCFVSQTLTTIDLFCRRCKSRRAPERRPNLRQLPLLLLSLGSTSTGPPAQCQSAARHADKWGVLTACRAPLVTSPAPIPKGSGLVLEQVLLVMCGMVHASDSSRRSLGPTSLPSSYHCTTVLLHLH